MDERNNYNSIPKQDSREEELLEQIKFCLLCKNEAQAIRLIEKYGYEQKEIHQCKDNQ